MKKFLSVFVLVLISRPSFTQLADKSYLGTLSLQSVQAEEAKWAPGLPLALSAVDYYKVTYASTNFKGAPTTVTGLLLIPKAGAPKGLIVYFHGTTSDRRFSPSRYHGWNSNLEVDAVAADFATAGYAVAVPDYLGLGDSPDIHPYPWGDVNSHSGIDMISPARDLASKVNEPIGKRLYITGYSEGGAVAMWAIRLLEEAGMPADLAAPMSGAYDLSGVTARFTVEDPPDLEDLAIRLYLLGYAGYSAEANLGLKLNGYFVPSFASYVPYLFSKGISDESIAAKLFQKGLQVGALQSIRRVLTHRFKEALSKGDTTDPFMAELAKNNCYDWTPHTRMLLPYLTTDLVVAPENTVEAVNAMRSHLSDQELVRAFPIENARLDHISAAPVAMLAARRFFDSDGSFPRSNH